MEDLEVQRILDRLERLEKSETDAIKRQATATWINNVLMVALIALFVVYLNVKPSDVFRKVGVVEQKLDSVQAELDARMGDRFSGSNYREFIKANPGLKDPFKEE